jgi:hypothetical protein
MSKFLVEAPYSRGSRGSQKDKPSFRPQASSHQLGTSAHPGTLNNAANVACRDSHAWRRSSSLHLARIART